MRGLKRAMRFWYVSTEMLQPVLQPGQIDGVFFRYQTRTLKRKSRSVSAPTGQMSTTLTESGLSSVFPGNSAIVE